MSNANTYPGARILDGVARVTLAGGFLLSGVGLTSGQAGAQNPNREPVVTNPNTDPADTFDLSAACAAVVGDPNQLFLDNNDTVRAYNVTLNQDGTESIVLVNPDETKTVPISASVDLVTVFLGGDDEDPDGVQLGSVDYDPSCDFPVVPPSSTTTTSTTEVSTTSSTTSTTEAPTTTSTTAQSATTSTTRVSTLPTSTSRGVNSTPTTLAERVLARTGSNSNKLTLMAAAAMCISVGVVSLAESRRQLRASKIK